MPPKKKIRLSSCGPCVSYFVLSPIGEMKVSSCADGLHSISQQGSPETKPDSGISVSLRAEENDENSQIPEAVSTCIRWLKAYFQDPATETRAPALCPAACSSKGVFMEKVWLTLKENIPCGKTTSYADLAKLAGNPLAVRAVGSAMRRNPFQLLVPCHRVVKSGGKNGHYCGGERNHVKEFLLRHENNNNSSSNYDLTKFGFK